MKKVISAIILFLVSISCYSQTKIDNKKLEFGFNFGVNRTNLRVVNPQVHTWPQINDKFGFDLGILMSYNPTNWLSILPQAELSFNSASIQYNWTDLNGVLLLNSQDEVYPVSLGFKTHFHFILEKEKNSPYIIVGPSVRFTIENDDNVSLTSFKSPPNFALDFGLGFDSKLKLFKFSPEIVYSLGLVDVNLPFDKVYYHKLSLVVNFKG